jgi:membrane protease subunit HflC
MRASRWVLASGVILAALLLSRTVFFVDEAEAALLTRMGTVQGGIYDAGAHLKSPLDEVHRIDRRLITRSYLGESFLTRDQKPLRVDYSIRWRLADASRLYAADGGDEDATAARLIEPVREAIKAALGAGTLAADAADPKLTDAIAGTAPLKAVAAQLGVELLDVQLQRIDLPEDDLNAVYQRMQQSLLNQAQQLHTQGSGDADRVRSEAEHRRADILADATREAQRIRGDADAAASAIYARAYASNPEFAAFTRSMQAYRDSLGKEGDVLVITPEGEFFKYLHSASGR